MPKQQQRLLAALCLTAAAFTYADDDNADNDNATWLDQTIAACQREFDAQRCQNSDFLNEHYHVDTLQIAHKATTRRKQEEQKALREILLQRLCGQDVKKFCAADGSEDCLSRTQNLCADLKTEAAQCAANAKQFCLEQPSDNCLAIKTAQCPSTTKQNLNVLLAKYPKLNESQKARLLQLAQRLDSSARSLLGDVLAWLGFGA